MGHILPSSHPGSARLCYNCRETHPYELAKGTASMSGLPSTEEREGDIFPLFSRYGAGAGYITLLIGYLFTVLTTTHLNLLSFLIFTVFQVWYSILLWLVWWLLDDACTTGAKEAG